MLEQQMEDWEEWMSFIGDYIKRGIRDGVVFSPFDRDLIRFYQSSDVMSRLLTCGEPVGGDFCGLFLSQGVQDGEDNRRDVYLSSHHWWACLQHRFGNFAPKSSVNENRPGC
jgi:hypothetical protein